MVMMFCTNKIIAQNTNNANIPNTVVASFSEKYPKAEIKKWEIKDDQYTAKATEDHHSFYATFDKSSQWVKTTSKISWSWNLPSEIKLALKKSKFAAWRVDGIKKVETTTGNSYQVLVDNLYQQTVGSQVSSAENYILEFKPNGDLFDKKSVSSPLLF